MINHIHTNFSIFIGEKWRDIYKQEDDIKVVFLYYSTCDLVSMCLIAKRSYGFYRNFFMPDIVYKDNNQIETGLVSYDFCQKYSYEEQKKLASKELKKFKLLQKQIPANILMKSSYEQISDKKYLLYFDDNFYQFYFFKKDKIKVIQNYLKLIEKYELDTLIDDKRLFLRFSMMEINQDFFKLMTKYPDNNFYYTMHSVFHPYYQEGFLELVKNVYINVKDNIKTILAYEKLASPLLKGVNFCEPFGLVNHGAEILRTGMLSLYNDKGRFIAYYPDNEEYVRTCFDINLLRAKIIEYSGDIVYLFDVLGHLTYLDQIIPFYKNMDDIIIQIIECLKNYITHIHQSMPSILNTKKLLLDVYDSDLTLDRLRKNLGID